MIDQIQAKAKALNKRIVLPEGEDARTLHAMKWIVDEGLAQPVLLGNPDVVLPLAKQEGIAIPAHVPLIHPAASEHRDAFAQTYYDLRKRKGATEDEARAAVADELVFGALMVRHDLVDGSVSGAAHPSPDVIRAAIRMIGVGEASALVSSFFLMVMPDGRVCTFADCAVNVEPEAEQLASIGLDAGRAHQQLTGATPRIAFLSFSTIGSAEHPDVDRVRGAVKLARERRPDWTIDGEFQFDSAYVPSVAARKAPNSPLQGDANVFVFPNLAAGNITYKAVQRTSGAEAIGPSLAGLSQPANDLSRGADAEDIVNVVCITALQADG